MPEFRRRHGWFVMVRGLEPEPNEWEAGYTGLFRTKREAMRKLREFRHEYEQPNELEFYLAKATLVRPDAEQRVR